MTPLTFNIKLNTVLNTFLLYVPKNELIHNVINLRIYYTVIILLKL